MWMLVEALRQMKTKNKGLYSVLIAGSDWPMNAKADLKERVTSSGEADDGIFRERRRVDRGD